MTELKFKLEKILCNSCRHFEDSGLKDFVQYSSKGYIKGKIQVRFYCHAYQEYLSKLYSSCVKHEQ
jgi:hypothetical protein